MEYVRQEIERDIEEGFDPGLQQSRGRTYRILRKKNRAIDSEVQARREWDGEAWNKANAHDWR